MTKTPSGIVKIPEPALQKIFDSANVLRDKIRALVADDTLTSEEFHAKAIQIIHDFDGKFITANLELQAAIKEITEKKQ